MILDMEEKIKTDVLVIGGAGAGLRAAIEARANGAEVLLVSKLPAAGTSCSLVMAGWITGVTQENEDELFKQIVYTGGYINNQHLVDVFLKDAIHRVPELRDFGVSLEWRGESKDMPGHYITSKIDKNPKGYALLQPMKDKAISMGVRIIDNMPISNLMTEGDVVTGAMGFELDTCQLTAISAKSTIIATGGGAYAFERSDNPPGSTGDGFALAYRAGAELIDMEFISLNVPRDMVQQVFGVSGEPPESLVNTGTAHYFLGGIKIDEDGNTSLKGLFAAGEVTGGLLGAARLGGSAVADTIVFGARAGKAAAQWAMSNELKDPNPDQINAEKNRFHFSQTFSKVIDDSERWDWEEIALEDVLADVKSILWRYMGPVKSEYTLNTGLRLLPRVEEQVSSLLINNPKEFLAVIEASNIIDLGRIIATASLTRKETRGNFWRSDYPQPDNEKWIKNIIISKEDKDVAIRFSDVVMTRLHHPTEPPIGTGCFWYYPRLDIS